MVSHCGITYVSAQLCSLSINAAESSIGGMMWKHVLSGRQWIATPFCLLFQSGNRSAACIKHQSYAHSVGNLRYRT